MSGSTYYFFARHDYRAFPLREQLFGDQNLTYEGKWGAILQNDWPGGATDNSVHATSNIQPSDPLTQVTTPVVEFAGTPEESFEWRGANEADGLLAVWIQALQGANQDWQYVVKVGSFISYLSYRTDSPAGDLSIDSFRGTAAPDGYQTETYYSHLTAYGSPICRICGLPAGKYRFRLVKVVNAQQGDTSGGNRATYLDGFYISTRIPA